MTFKNIIYILFITLFFLIIVSLWGFYSAIRPWRIVSDITPTFAGIPFKEIQFKTPDGVIIRGWFLRSPHPRAKTIILLHGYPADKGDILPSRLFLFPHYNLLFIDFRYLGKSGGRYSTVGKDEVLDVLAALEYLEKENIHEVGIWGLSMGGAVAIMAAEKSSKIKVIVAESSYAQLDLMAKEYFKIPLIRYPLATLLRFWAYLFFGTDLKKISPMKSAEKLTIPILLIHSRHDAVVSFEHAELLKKSLQKNPQAEFLFYDDLHHGESSRDYQKILSDFFAKNL